MSEELRAALTDAMEAVAFLKSAVLSGESLSEDENWHVNETFLRGRAALATSPSQSGLPTNDALARAMHDADRKRPRGGGLYPSWDLLTEDERIWRRANAAVVLSLLAEAAAEKATP